MAVGGEVRLVWRCVACRCENHIVSVGGAHGGRETATGGRPSGPFETACAHCRTRHILVSDPGDLAHIAPREQIGRVGRMAGIPRVLLAAGLAAAGALGIYTATQVAENAASWAVLGLVGVVAGGLSLRRRRAAEAFLACDSGLQVRGPDGRSRGLIPWEKIRGAEYRLLLGRRMALWLAVEGRDGSVPAAPLVAETGIALFTRARAMPQFLMALAARLGDRVRFILPILALGPGRGGRAVALRSEVARRLVAGTLEGRELTESLGEGGED